jgi:predicted DNA-binding transcriptional regulator AlpA
MTVLLIKDVMQLLRVSRPTIYRWIRESKEGLIGFPLPISAAGRQLRWNAEDIERFYTSQHTPLPVETAPVELECRKCRGYSETLARLGLPETSEEDEVDE